jgi:hypothetical protein
MPFAIFFAFKALIASLEAAYLNGADAPSFAA